MVVYSKEVEDSLNDIWLDAVLNGKSLNTYVKIRDGLRCLDKGYINRQDSQYPAWKHLNLYEVDFGNHQFGYSFDGANVSVEYYYNPLKKESMERNINTIRLTEAQFKRMLTECITKIINEIA